MKKLLLPLLSIILFISLVNGQGENFVKVKIKSPVKFGEVIIANITIEANEPIMGIQFNVTFNGLEAISIEKGDFFDYWANDFAENFTVIDNENGSIYNVVAFSNSPVIGKGVVARIYFKSIAEGVATVNLTNVVVADENGNATDATILNTSIYVDATAPSINLIETPAKNTTEKNVTFSWNATDDLSLNIKFSYKLDNINWSNWGENLSVSYENLSYGSHLFQLKAVDEAGNIAWLNYSFNITDKNPPFINEFQSITFK